MKIEKKKKYFIIDGKVKYGPYQAANDPIFSLDKSAGGFIAYNEGRYYVVVNGKEYGPYDSVESLEFSPDGSHWSFVFRKSPYEYSIMIDNKEYGPYDWVYSPDLSKEGWKFAYIKGKKVYGIENDIVRGPFNLVSAPSDIFAKYEEVRYGDKN